MMTDSEQEMMGGVWGGRRDKPEGRKEKEKGIKARSFQSSVFIKYQKVHIP